MTEEELEAVSPGLHALCRALVRRTPVSAEDLFQETVRRALEGPYRPEGSLKAWLAVVARNAFLNLLEKERRPPVPVPGREERGWVSVEIRDLLDRLSPELREAVALRFFQGLSVQEASEVLGVSPATFKRRLAEAMEILVESEKT